MRLAWLSGLLLLTPLLASAQVPRRAPGFALPDYQQRTIDLQDYRGKVVVLEFMQTTCPHCQEVTAVLEQVRGKYRDKVAVLSVVLPPDTLPQVQQYVAKHRVSWPVMFDCGQMTASYLRITPANPKVNLPHLVVIDPTGQIRHEAAYASEAAKPLFSVGAISQAVEKLLPR